jgi:multidrug efflux pump subunit AcrB
MLPQFGIKRPYTVIVAIIVIGILGAVSVMNTTVDLLPSINLPYAIVITPYIGANPEQVETVVTRPIEQSMASISNIHSVRSISRENMSLVILEFIETTNMDSAIIEMREGLDMLGSYLPSAVGRSTIMRLNPDMMPVTVLSAAIEGVDIDESSAFIEETVIPALESVEGVASVTAIGLVDRQIVVRLNEEKISQTTERMQTAIMGAMLSSATPFGPGASESVGSQLSGLAAFMGNKPQQTPSPSTTGSPLSGAFPALAGQFTGLLTQASPGIADEGAASAQLPASPQGGGAASAQSPTSPQSGGLASTQPPTLRLSSQLLSKDMIAGILKGQNFEMPAGYVSGDGADYLVRVGEAIDSLEQLRSLPVFVPPFPGVEPVVLGDVADIFVTDNSDAMYTKVNGNDAVIMTVQKQTEYATSDVSRRILSRTEELQEAHPGLELVPLMDQGQYIRMAVGAIANNLLIGGLLAIAILLAFLRDVRPTLVVGFSIPVSLVAAFVMMYFSNVTLNVMSMGGLALGVGMLVDNSIVVIENIYRMRAEGKPPAEAAIEGAVQVTGAITASTLTTIAVFVPIIFTQGLTRQLFTEMGLTIAYSLLASLAVALTLVPMVASRITSGEGQLRHRAVGRMKELYSKLLAYSLDHKPVVVGLVMILFIASTVGALSLGTELMPETDTGQIMITVTLPRGTTLAETAAAADQVMSIVSDVPEVETVGASIGGGMMGMGGMTASGARGGNTDSVSMYVPLKEDRSRPTAEIAQTIRDKTSDLEFEVAVSDATMDISALRGSTVAVRIGGRDLDTLKELATEVAGIVSSVEGTIDVSDGLDRTSPELRVMVDKAKSLANGLTVAQVFMEISQLLASDSAVTSIPVGGRDVDVYVEDYASAPATVDDVTNLIISTPLGTEVVLEDVADIEEARGFESITRESQQRYITVSAELAEGYNVGKVSGEIERRLAELDVPEGYSVTMGGEQELLRISFRDLFLMLVLGVIFIYLVMVAQFQSLLSPFIVMFTLPLAFTGGFLGLIIARMPVSTPAALGLIILCGVVVNNAIVFVDYANKMMEGGMGKRDAIMKAGADRLRPILMTALTTIIALSTTSIGVGQGAEIMQPVSVTAIGGLLYAALLTLVFIPVLYERIVREKAPVS